MSTWFNPNTFNQGAAQQLQAALAFHCQSNPAAAAQALQLLQHPGFCQQQQQFQQFAGQGMPATGCMPTPGLGYSGCPAGKGLSKNPKGWPNGAVKTAGGYTVVPEGNTNWSIYAPGQKHGEKPHTRVWGDPHVTEKDGTRWDFTKSSDFVLPDGTRIAAKTSSEKGHSVTTGLTISNGADKVDVTGVNGRPKTGSITHDGYQWRAAHTAKGKDTFRLGGDKTNVQWFKESGGKSQGLITGAKYNAANQQYEQVTCGKNKYCVDSSMRPPLGSAAWGNQFRGELADAAGMRGNKAYAQQMGQLMAADHWMGQMFGGQIGSVFGQQGQDFGGQFGGQFGQMGGCFSPFGGMGSCFGGFGQGLGALGMCGDTMMQHWALQQAMQGQQYGCLPVGMQHTETTKPGRPASFPKSNSSGFVDCLPGNKHQVAKKLNVSGSHDVRVINDAAGKLKNAGAVVCPAKPGEKGKAGKLVLTQQEVDAIRSAKTEGDAKKIVAQAISRQTGVNVSSINMNDKCGIRNKKNRNALNKLLGTNVRNGTEKNSGSSMVLDSIMESTAKSIRGGNFGTTVHTDHFGFAGMGGVGGTSDSHHHANGSSALSVDLNGYKSAADKVAELYSPLIFDLDGTGLKLQNSGMIEVDLDGDGKTELVSDLDAYTGLLVFDSKQDDTEEGRAYGRDMFGNGTDMSAYDITGPKDDGTFNNGFEALRAMAEKYELVKGSKQHLDAEDLKFLENEVQLRMRVGGIADGEDRRFSAVGISRIDLGAADKIKSLDESPEDQWGNKLMHQEGATFVVHSDTRQYADIWFNILARVLEQPDKELDAKSGSDLLANVAIPLR